MYILIPMSVFLITGSQQPGEHLQDWSNLLGASLNVFTPNSGNLVYKTLEDRAHWLGYLTFRCKNQKHDCFTMDRVVFRAWQNEKFTAPMSRTATNIPPKCQVNNFCDIGYVVASSHFMDFFR